MRLSNTTDLDNETVRAVLRFVCPPGVSGYNVRVTNARHRGSGWASWKRGFTGTVGIGICLRIGGSQHFPQRPYPLRQRGGYLPLPYFASRLEWLVYVAAHELRHLWQARVPRGRRVWGARGQFSERDADAYAIRLLREWRRAQ